MLRYHAVTMLIGAIAVAGGLLLADPPLEDEPGWDCATMGNHVCGKV